MHQLPASWAPSRPTTAGMRPSTSSGNEHDDIQFSYGYRGRTADDLDDLDEDDEESSDDEDVFAFLPPTTADVQQQQQHHAIQQQPHQHANPLSSAQPAFPSPTFDPYARYPAESPRPEYSFSGPPQTPPSTDSTADQDPYRLKRLSQRQHTATTASSQAVHVSLPSTAEKDAQTQQSGSRYRRRKRSTRTAATAATVTSVATGSDGTSMFEDEDTASREGSIKCVTSSLSTRSPAHLQN